MALASSPLARIPPAAGAFLAYLAGALLVGECAPFSRFPMYALADYPQGGVLVVRADGQEQASLRDFVAFEGIDASALRYPPGYHFSSEYLLDALRHHVQVHPASGAPATTPVRLEIGLRVAEPSPEGPVIVHDFLPMAEGRAWSRP